MEREKLCGLIREGILSAIRTHPNIQSNELAVEVAAYVLEKRGTDSVRDTLAIRYFETLEAMVERGEIVETELRRIPTADAPHKKHRWFYSLPEGTQ